MCCYPLPMYEATRFKRTKTRTVIYIKYKYWQAIRLLAHYYWKLKQCLRNKNKFCSVSLSKNKSESIKILKFQKCTICYSISATLNKYLVTLAYLFLYTKIIRDMILTLKWSSHTWSAVFFSEMSFTFLLQAFNHFIRRFLFSGTRINILSGVLKVVLGHNGTIQYL